jgi:hypothetical protein
MAIAVETPVLLVKKIGGVLLLLFGLLLTALGLSGDSGWLTTIGLVFLVAGAISLTLKIMRRNQGRQP